MPQYYVSSWKSLVWFWPIFLVVICEICSTIYKLLFIQKCDLWDYRQSYKNFCFWYEEGYLCFDLSLIYVRRRPVECFTIRAVSLMGHIPYIISSSPSQEQTNIKSCLTNVQSLFPFCYWNIATVFKAVNPIYSCNINVFKKGLNIYGEAQYHSLHLWLW